MTQLLGRASQMPLIAFLDILASRYRRQAAQGDPKPPGLKQHKLATTRVRRALEGLQLALKGAPGVSLDLEDAYSDACSLSYADAVEASGAMPKEREMSMSRWVCFAADRGIASLEGMLSLLLATARDDEHRLKKLRGAKGRRPAKRALARLAVTIAKALVQAGHSLTTYPGGKFASVCRVVLGEAGGSDEEMPEYLIKRAVAAAVRKGDSSGGKGARRNQ